MISNVIFTFLVFGRLACDFILVVCTGIDCIAIVKNIYEDYSVQNFDFEFSGIPEKYKSLWFFAHIFFSVHFETQLLSKKVFSMKFCLHWYIIHYVLEKVFFTLVVAQPGNLPPPILPPSGQSWGLGLGSWVYSDYDMVCPG